MRPSTRTCRRVVAWKAWACKRFAYTFIDRYERPRQKCRGFLHYVRPIVRSCLGQERRTESSIRLIRGIYGRFQTDKAVESFWDVHAEDSASNPSSPYLKMLMQRAIIHSIEIVGGVLMLILARLLQLH